MKKKLFNLLAIAVILLSAVSCSKDDDPKAAEEIQKEYTSEELTVSNGDEEIDNGKVTIKATGDNTVQITLDNIVNGYETFVVNAVTVKTKAIYEFEGTESVDGMTVIVTGTVENGKAKVNVKIKMTSSEILGDWTLNTSADNSYSCFHFTYKNGSGKSTWMGQSITNNEFAANFTAILNLVAGMGMKDPVLTFNENGYVDFSGTALFSSEGGIKKINEKNLVRYYYNPKTKMLIFDAAIDMSKMSGSTKADKTVQMYIPFNCSFDSKGALTAIIGKDFQKILLAMIPTGDKLQALLAQLDSKIPADYSQMLPMIKLMIQNAVEQFTDPTAEISIGGILKPYE